MATASRATFGLRPAILGVPVLPEARLAVVARTGIRTEAASPAAALDPLAVHAPDAGVAASLRVAHGLPIGVGTPMAPRVRILVLATVVPTVATTLDVQEGVPAVVAVLPTRVTPATGGAARPTATASPVTGAAIQAPAKPTAAMVRPLPSRGPSAVAPTPMAQAQGTQPPFGPTGTVAVLLRSRVAIGTSQTTARFADVVVLVGPATTSGRAPAPDSELRSRKAATDSLAFLHLKTLAGSRITRPG